MTSPTRPARPVFLYDADCGVCDRGVARIRARVRPSVDLLPYQSVDLARLGVTEAECLDGPVLVHEDGTHVVGPPAVAGMLRTAGAPFRSIGSVMSLPIVSAALGRLGPIAYRNRYRLPGAGDSCRTVPAGPVAEVSS